jgi:hypothetical protein
MVKIILLDRSGFTLLKRVVVGEKPKTGTTNKPTQKLKHIIQLNREPKKIDLVFIISLSGLNILLWTTIDVIP